MLQGSSPIQDAQSGEEFLHARRIPAKSGCDILRPRRAEQSDGRVPQRGHRLRTEALTDPARVLAERHVAYVMRPILDRPMAPGPEEQLPGARDLARHARDEIPDLC